MESRLSPAPGEPTVNILIVDDLPEKLLVFETILEELQENVVSASSGREALQQILSQDFAVILLDVNMPDIDGFETAKLIRQYHRSRKTPIIFITSYMDDVQTARGYALGAVDYIAAPVVPEILRSKVKVFVDLHRLQLQLQIHVQEREALAHAEAARAIAEAASRRADMLAKASHVLSRSLDVNTTVAELLRFVTAAVTDTVVVVLVDTHEQIICAQLAQGRPHFAQIPLAHLPSFVRDLLPAWNAGADLELPMPFSGPHDLHLVGPDETQLIVTVHQGMIFRISAGGSFRGALLLVDTGNQLHFPADPALVREVMSRAAIALENALLYRTIVEGDRRKSEFLAMLAHELRNPLAPIRNAVELLKIQQLKAPPKQTDVDQHAAWAADVIARQVDHMAHLMDDLLDVSRIGYGKFALDISTVLVADFIQFSIEAVQPLLADRGQQLHVDLPPYSIAVQGDAVRLAQIISNLLNNASKYSPRNSVITLRATLAEDFLCIAVRDHGEGIAPELLPMVFNMFTQGEKTINRLHGGLGVGLSLVKHLVELHGGRVEAFSAGRQCGAEFVVHLPACRTCLAADNNKSVEATGAANAEPHRVLVIDDMIESAETMARLLTMKGFDVAVAFDGASAIERAESFQPDVVLLDVGMPGMDGYEVAHRLRARQLGVSNVLLVALTGYGAEEDQDKTRAAGFDAHFVKPANIDALLALMIQHCEAAVHKT